MRGVVTTVKLEGFPEKEGLEIEVEHHFGSVDVTVIRRNPPPARDEVTTIIGMSPADARRIGRALLGLAPSDAPAGDRYAILPPRGRLFPETSLRPSPSVFVQGAGGGGLVHQPPRSPLPNPPDPARFSAVDRSRAGGLLIAIGPARDLRPSAGPFHALAVPAGA